MRFKNPSRLVLVGLVLSAGMFSSGRGQEAPAPGDTVPTITTGLAHENAGAGSLASRSPGHLVNAGVLSAQNAVKLGRTTSATITATEEDDEDGFFARAADILLEAIDNLLLYFVNLLLTRAGLPALIPDNFNLNDNDNDNGNTNTNTNSNGNTNTNSNTNDNTDGNTNTNSNVNANDNGNDNTGPPGGVGGNDVSNDNTTRPGSGGVRKGR
jgi:hypothetical protein